MNAFETRSQRSPESSNTEFGSQAAVSLAVSPTGEDQPGVGGFRDCSYIVTGGAGFIGSHVVEALLQQNVSVLCIDNFDDVYDPQRKLDNVRRHLAHRNFELEVADIRDAERMQRIFKRFQPEGVIHLAARAGVRPSLLAPRLYQDINVGGTINILEAARAVGVRRVVVASSSSVYGENPHFPFREEDSLQHLSSPYAASKLSGEALCQVYAGTHGMSIASMRFFTVYGPRQRPDMAISKFVDRILRGEAIDLYGDGSSIRDYTYVGDICDGLLQACRFDGEGHEVFNLGCGRPISLNEMVDVLEELCQRPVLRNHLAPPPGDVPVTWADWSKAQILLGYQPRMDFREGVQKYLESLSRPYSSIQSRERNKPNRKARNFGEALWA